MRPLRAYLIVRLGTGEMEVSIHRDLESVEDAWRAIRCATSSAALHVGFWRPDTEAFESALASNPDRMLLTDSARHALLPGFASSSRPVGTAGALPLSLALSGWGYETTDPFRGQSDPPARTMGRESAARRHRSEWLPVLNSSDPTLVAEAASAGVINEESYLAAEPRLPATLASALARARLAILSGTEPQAWNVIDMLHDAPERFLGVPVSAFDFSIRIRNVLSSQSIELVGDLAQYGSKGVRSFVNLGAKSFGEIGEAILSLLCGEINAVPARKANSGATHGWLTALATKDPDLSFEAAAAGVTDENAYSELESVLSFDLRGRLGMARFLHHTCGTMPAGDRIIDHLAHAPPWLASLPVSLLRLSTRPDNALSAKGIEKIGDLAAYGSEDVFRFQNLGRKSFLEICASITALLRIGPGAPAVAATLRGSAAEFPDHVAGGGTTPSPPQQGDSLSVAIDQAFGLLTESEKSIMVMRMGLGQKTMTLNEIGDARGVTRERIRQIESRCVGKMASLPFWDADFAVRLDALLDRREDALPLEGLEILDSWFDGAAELGEAFGYAAERFPKHPFHLVRKGPQTYVTRIRQQQWIDASKAARILLESLVGRKTPEAEARALVEGMLIGDGEELRSELWHLARRHAHFADEGAGSVLICYGFGAENLVEALLSSSDRPLHYSEIHARLVQEGYALDQRRAHNAASAVGLLYGRGIYGMTRHFPLNEPETRLLVSEAEDIVAGHDLSKQWHAREICELLEERGLDCGGLLNPYLLSIALSRSQVLSYLGRMVWASTLSGVKGSANRLDIHQAIVSVIQDAGRPLPSEEIKKILSRDRGLNYYFQVQPEGSLIRVGAALWGLAERDLPFSVGDSEAILLELQRILEAKGKALHVSEIIAAVSPAVPSAANAKDSIVFFGLAQQRKEFSVSKGQYLYLTEWHSPRRLTVLDAATRVLEAAGPQGLAPEDGCPRIAALIERPFPKTLYSSTCNALGARFNHETCCWYLEPESTDESDDHAEKQVETA